MTDLATNKTDGFGLKCSNEGHIEEILFVDEEFKDSIALGSNFLITLEKSNGSKVFSFMAKVRSAKSAFDWELVVTNRRSQPLVLCFVGYVVKSGILIIAAQDVQSLADLTTIYCREDLVDEKAVLDKSRSQHILTKSLNMNEMQNDLVRMNNELLTMQRALSKKMAISQQSQRELVGLLAELKSEINNLQTEISNQTIKVKAAGTMSGNTDIIQAIEEMIRLNSEMSEKIAAAFELISY